MTRITNDLIDIRIGGARSKHACDFIGFGNLSILVAFPNIPEFSCIPKGILQFLGFDGSADLASNFLDGKSPR